MATVNNDDQTASNVLMASPSVISMPLKLREPILIHKRPGMLKYRERSKRKQKEIKYDMDMSLSTKTSTKYKYIDHTEED